VQLPERFTRGRLFGLAAAGGAAALLPGGEAEAGPNAVATGAVTCVLSPEMTEGPYYVPNEAVRRDITEGKDGTPLRLHLSVVDVSSCKPVKGAAVDVWHADSGGVYSGVAGNSGTFMRGIQRTDRTGLATFDTIYPGWYHGRAVHIHVKVHVGGNVVHTGQLYFPDSLTDKVFRRKPYSRRPGRTPRNANDFVFAQGGRRSLLSLRKAGSAYVGRITLGVTR